MSSSVGTGAGELPAATSCHRRQERSRFVSSEEEELVLQVTAAEKILLVQRTRIYGILITHNGQNWDARDPKT